MPYSPRRPWPLDWRARPSSRHWSRPPPWSGWPPRWVCWRAPPFASSSPPGSTAPHPVSSSVSPNEGLQRHVPAAVHGHPLVSERRVQQYRARQTIRHGAPREQCLRAGAHAGPLEPHRHHHAAVIGGRQIERPLQQRIAEVRPLEIHPHLEPGGADAVLGWVVDVEHQLERAARQAHAGAVDLLQLELGLLKRQAPEGSTCETQHDHGKRETRNGKRAVSCHYVSPLPFPLSRSFICLQNSIRFLMSCSNPNSLGSYHFCPRSASGR